PLEFDVVVQSSMRCPARCDQINRGTRRRRIRELDARSGAGRGQIAGPPGYKPSSDLKTIGVLVGEAGEIAVKVVINARSLNGWIRKCFRPRLRGGAFLPVSYVEATDVVVWLIGLPGDQYAPTVSGHGAKGLRGDGGLSGGISNPDSAQVARCDHGRE